MDKAIEKRIVKTGIENTAVNLDIFKSVIGQMSDGIWENTKGMTSYWSDADIIEVDNEIAIEVARPFQIMYRDWGNSWRTGTYCIKWRQNKYASMSDTEILKFFKNKIRCIVKHEDKDNLELSSMTEEEKVKKYWFSPTYKIPERRDFSWDAKNKTELSYLDYKSGVTVGDAFKVVKALSNRIK